MRRNWKTVRKILEQVESGDLLSYIRKQAYLQDEISENELDGHLEILIDAGLIKNCSVRRSASGEFAMVSVGGVYLTMEGHDLLDSIRDTTVWGRVLRKAQDAGVAVSWEFIKAAVPAVMKELVR